MPSRADESQDQTMEDAPDGVASPAPEPKSQYDDQFQVEKQRLRQLPGSSKTAASFEFTKEDHTLGNALRYVIMKNPSVEFCGYSIPHPSEERMNLRIQTYDDVDAYDVLQKGLNDLMDLCDVVLDKFITARDELRKDAPSS
ncbi:DNA-directed RNA polymerases I and III subunit RPAC2 [Cryomyces minteri]|uniref:DNA-directed RNA polymerases I and III subunit RPAC2 n=1 Tax=Cryomyces minteri TaxID=331657 RepID=A0A4U0XMA4_9PEZI|nr:DNA-directed RNA polymerases I and III subunit RPAC2 [Cryomyces minteri]